MNVDAPRWSACTVGLSIGSCGASDGTPPDRQLLPMVDELQHVAAERRELGDLLLDGLEQPADVVLERVELGGRAR